MQSQFQRTLLWVIFGMSLFLLWDKWQAHNGQASMFGPKPSATAAGGNGAPGQGGAAPAKPDTSVPSAASAPVSGAAPAAPATAPATQANGASESGQLIKLGNDLLALEIDALGAQVKRAELLKQKDLDDKTRNVVLLNQRPGQIYVAQAGWVGAPQGPGYPTHRTPYALVDGPKEVGGAQQVVLSGESGGLKVVRTFTLKPGEYVLGVTDEVTNTSAAPMRPTMYMQLARDNAKPSGESQFYSTYTGPVMFTEKAHFQKVDFADIDKGKPTFEKMADDGWTGIIQHYFVAAWLPVDKQTREYYFEKIDANLYRIGAKQVTPVELAPGATSSLATRLLVAPQDQHMLEKVAPGLELTVDYGWLTVIAKPIFHLLQWLYTLVGNWGWAIVLLTIVIKTAFFPLQAASYKSMARMKAVTPRMQQIRERYGSDRAKMNQAMMELYKEEKINPLGGCLPIVVQIPVFIALYWVLLASVEMRNAPWLGWIQDLAAPDPYYILPAVMAITMFIQTKLNPTPPDPIQAKMMLFMPLIFSVMFFFFPSGLVLYWLVNNVYSIIQQWLITKKMQGAKAA